MRRLFWFGAGVAAGVAVSRKVQETARKAAPTGMAEQLGGAMRELAGALGSFGAEVRAGMSEREDELHNVVEQDATTGAARHPNGRRGDATGWRTEEIPAVQGRRARRAGR